MARTRWGLYRTAGRRPIVDKFGFLPDGRRRRDHARRRRDAGFRLPRWFVTKATGGHSSEWPETGSCLIVRSHGCARFFRRFFCSRVELAFIYVPLVVARLYVGGPEHGGGDRVRCGRTRGVDPVAAGRGDRDSQGKRGRSSSDAPFSPRSGPRRSSLGDLVSSPSCGRRERPRAALFRRVVHAAVRLGDRCDQSRVMTFAYLPTNIGFVIGPAVGSVVAPWTSPRFPRRRAPHRPRPSR